MKELDERGRERGEHRLILLFLVLLISFLPACLAGCLFVFLFVCWLPGLTTTAKLKTDLISRLKTFDQLKIPMKCMAIKADVLIEIQRVLDEWSEESSKDVVTVTTYEIGLALLARAIVTKVRGVISTAC